MYSPCANCPWRKDAPREYWDPQHFTDIWGNCQDDGMHSMLCHFSKPDEGVKRLCAGWVAVIGFASIGLRIEAMTGRFNPDEWSDGGHELFPDFASMLEANGIEVPSRNRNPLEGFFR